MIERDIYIVGEIGIQMKKRRERESSRDKEGEGG